MKIGLIVRPKYNNVSFVQVWIWSTNVICSEVSENKLQNFIRKSWRAEKDSREPDFSCSYLTMLPGSQTIWCERWDVWCLTDCKGFCRKVSCLHKVLLIYLDVSGRTVLITMDYNNIKWRLAPFSFWTLSILQYLKWRSWKDYGQSPET
jgi:hypothetical protein